MNTGGEANQSKDLKQANTGETEEPETPLDAVQKQSLIQAIRERMAQIRDRRRRPPSAGQARAAKSADRSRGFLLLAGSVVAVIFIFLAMFSNSSAPQQARRTTPNLGRPETPVQGVQEKTGSVTPLLNADPGSPDSNGDQVSPDDVKATARFRASAPPPKSTPNTLADIPPMNDPALEAYRQARMNGGVVPAQPAPASTPPTGVPQRAPAIRDEVAGLRKSSLIFVRTTSNSAGAIARPTPPSAEPAFLEYKRSVLPSGSRLVARLQASVSTAVKAPVVATVEYNYEQDGEIIVPAGTKAFGDLQQANRNGTVSIKFHTLQKPDGTTETIDAGATSLTYGPLKGSVGGSNRAKRILVRSMTGVGTMAAYVVGGRGGFGGLNGQLDSSVLLRERMASNIGLAGEQELTTLAFSENIVVTVPGNTRFFIVLHYPTGEKGTHRMVPARSVPNPQLAAASNTLLPSAQEIRELIELKSELNRMYREVSATRSSSAERENQE